MPDLAADAAADAAAHTPADVASYTSAYAAAHPTPDVAAHSLPNHEEPYSFPDDEGTNPSANDSLPDDAAYH
jgi:hypothetical protein